MVVPRGRDTRQEVFEGAPTQTRISPSIRRMLRQIRLSGSDSGPGSRADALTTFYIGTVLISRRGDPQKALRGGVPGAVLEPLGWSWSHFVSIYRQNLTRSLEN